MGPVLLTLPLLLFQESMSTTDYARVGLQCTVNEQENTRGSLAIEMDAGLITEAFVLVPHLPV